MNDRNSHVPETHFGNIATFDIDSEYESVCDYMAKRNRKGETGDPLPMGISTACQHLIENNPDCFQQRIKQHAYALAMVKIIGDNQS